MGDPKHNLCSSNNDIQRRGNDTKSFSQILLKILTITKSISTCYWISTGAHSASYSFGVRILSRAVKRPEREVDHLPQSSAEVNPLKTKRVCFIQGLIAYRAVNALNLGYTKTNLLTFCKTKSRCLLWDRTKHINAMWWPRRIFEC
jgi:hypothetical protein